MKTRVLLWQITPTREGSTCSSWSWTYPDPLKLTEQSHDTSQVQRRFDEHICSNEIPPKKFSWSYPLENIGLIILPSDLAWNMSGNPTNQMG
jgi:hypothetical protein